MRVESASRKYGTVIATLLISACSSTIEVNRQNTITPVLEESGIYYSLPKTQIITKIPARLIVQTEGFLKACEKDPSFPMQVEDNNLLLNSNNEYVMNNDAGLDSNSGSPVPTVLDRTLYFGQASISSRAVADPNHLYHLDVDFDTFSSFTHTVELSESGVVNSINSKVDNIGPAIAIESVKTIAGILQPPIQAAIAQEDARPISPFCKELFEKKSMLEGVSEGPVKALIELEKTWIEWLLGAGRESEPQSFQAALKYFETRKSKLQEQISEAEVLLYGATQSFHYMFIGISEPSEFKVFGEPIKEDLHADSVNDDSNKTKSNTTVWSLEWLNPDNIGVINPGHPGVVALSVDEITQSQLQDGKLGSLNLNSKINIVIEPVEEEFRFEDVESDCKANSTELQKRSNQEDNKEGCEQSTLVKSPGVIDAKGGYRYRIPVLATVTVFENWSTKNVKLGRYQDSVAQFGPIASLPSTIDGIQASIVPTYDPETGSLTKVTLGAVPVPASQIGEFGGQIQNFIANREAIKVEQEGEELASLQAENKLLEAKKTNKSLKSDLGLE